MDIEGLGKILHLELIMVDNHILITHVYPKHVDFLLTIGDKGVNNVYNSFKRRFPERTHDDFVEYSCGILNANREDNPSELDINDNRYVKLLRNAKLNNLMGK